ncbi:MAG: hypothetical protein ACR2PJ_03620 [Pseudomonadales bacterium]
MTIIKTLKAIGITLALLALVGPLAGCYNALVCDWGYHMAWVDDGYECVPD